MFDKFSAATLKVDYSLMGERELLERFHLPESEAFKDGSIIRRSAPERLCLTLQEPKRCIIYVCLCWHGGHLLQSLSKIQMVHVRLHALEEGGGGWLGGEALRPIPTLY